VLDRWVAQYLERGSEAFPNTGGQAEDFVRDQRMRELEALVGRQALEIEFLKAAIKKGEELAGRKRK
jgi:hypothetical protein